MSDTIEENTLRFEVNKILLGFILNNDINSKGTKRILEIVESQSKELKSKDKEIKEYKKYERSTLELIREAVDESFEISQMENFINGEEYEPIISLFTHTVKENTSLKKRIESLEKVIITSYEIMKTFDEQRAYEYLTLQVELLNR